MSDDERETNEPPERTLTLRLTRDNLFLMAAVVFLMVAILISIALPAGANNPSASATSRATRSSLPSPTGQIAIVPTAASTIQPQPAFPQNPTEPPAPGQQAPAYPVPATVIAATTTSLPGARPTSALPTAVLPTAAVPNATPLPGGVILPVGSTLTPIPGGVVQTATPVASTPQLQPTARPAQPAPAQPQPVVTRKPTDIPPTATPIPPTAVPVDVLRGTTYWTAARSPIVVGRNVQIPVGSALIIESGAEVRLAPGVSITVDGKLYSLGQPGRPARIVASGGGRWDGIYAHDGADVVLEQTEIRQGGAGGTAIFAQGGSLALRGVTFSDNGGNIRAEDARVEIRASEIAGNDIPFGAVVDASFSASGSFTLVDSRIGGNRLSNGTPSVWVKNQSALNGIAVDIQHNLILGQDGPNLQLQGNGQVSGKIACNALVSGTNGLSIKSTMPQVPGMTNLAIRDNAIEKHTPPIIPIYLKYGIGRGATSDVRIDMRGNWWGSAFGPYEPDRHADGRGDAPGDTVSFDGWLTARPACAPQQ